MDDGEARTGKRDRLARLGRVMAVLRAHPDGIRVEEIARRVDMSVRTVYRDLRAIEGELGVATWSDGGTWGVAGEAFLPPLKLTLSEAMAVFLSARLMV
ncbi:MAG: HTH domain-containing protein, partial [Chloroflexota bacterium]